MGIELFAERNNTKSQRGNRPFGNLQSVDKPKATVWLNVGYEVNGKFINLPIGLPIDTMESADVRGQNTDWVKQKNAQNALLLELQRFGASLEPGQEQTVNLEVRIRRVNDELVVKSTDNEYVADFRAMLVPAAAE